MQNHETTQHCEYPSCACPFDAPADRNWCAKGRTKRTVIGSALPDHEKIQKSVRTDPMPHIPFSEQAPIAAMSASGIVFYIVAALLALFLLWADMPWDF